MSKFSVALIRQQGRKSYQKKSLLNVYVWEASILHIEEKAGEIIYVRLLDEQVDVYRPVAAFKLGNNVYQISQSEFFNPEDESWEFLPGSIVVVEPRVLTSGTVLLAIRLDYTKR